MKTVLLGIDPSFVTMGICLYNPTTKEMKLRTDEFLSGIDWISANCRLRDVIAVVENPALDSTTFDMWALMKDAIDNLAKGRIVFKNGAALSAPSTAIGEARSQFAVCMNYAQKVGENKAAAKLIITMLRKYGVPVIEIAPSKRDKAFVKKNGAIVRRDVRFLKMPTKTTQSQFEEFTGFKGSSAEHARDAATLVFGRTITWALNTVEIDEAKKTPATFPATENNNYFIVENKKEQ